MSKEKKGRIWPYAIVGSIILIIIASAMTVVVAVKHPVEMSDANMQNYHVYDKHANSFIEAAIAFDKQYKITYASNALDKENAVVAYKLVDARGNAVNNAKLDIVLTRPDNHKSDIVLDKADVTDGIYTFNVGKLPLEGRWNIMAHAVVGEYERYFNLKADTRYPNAFEY